MVDYPPFPDRAQTGMKGNERARKGTNGHEWAQMGTGRLEIKGHKVVGHEWYECYKEELNINLNS